MEESCENGLTEQLRSIETLENNMIELRKQLQLLTKQQVRVAKSTEDQYMASLKKVECRINLAKNEKELESLRIKRQKQYLENKDNVKRLRRQNQQMLSAVRSQFKIGKQNEVKNIKNSLQQQKLKMVSLRQRDMERKKQLISSIHQQKNSSRLNKQASRIIQLKYKQKQLLNSQIQKVNTKQKLQRQMVHLRAQIQQVQSRISLKRKVSCDIQQGTKSILKLPHEHINKLISAINKSNLKHQHRSSQAVPQVDVKAQLLKSFIIDKNQ